MTSLQGFHIPPEIFDFITFYVGEYKPPKYVRDPFGLFDPDILTPRSRGYLGSLRLVNKAFCRSASVQLFRSIDARCPFWTENTSRVLANLYAIARSPYASYVHTVVVGHWDNLPNRSRLACDSYIDDLLELLPICLSHLPNLAALRLEPADARGIHVSEQLSDDAMELLEESVVKALRYVPLPRLKDLSIGLSSPPRLWLPFEPGAIACRIPFEQVLQQLQHLNLKVPAEADEFLYSCIELLGDLSSLRISSEVLLDLDGCDFSRPGHLTAIALHNFTISSTKLLSLLQRNRTTSLIDLSCVFLNSGRWQDVLDPLADFAGLIGFRTVAISYSWPGESASLAPESPASTLDGCAIETNNSLDFNALGGVQRRVNSNRQAANLEQIDSDDYEYIDREPLKDVPARMDG